MGNDDLKSIGDIDKMIHEPSRLMIMSLLYVVESADFLFIMRQTEMTWGNLSSHMSKLEAAGYIKVEKEFLERKPHTILSMTEGGRGAFERYRDDMQKILESMGKE
ncbi:MAG TPA: transcriptional regulator [Candidatus Methanofastidiosa archaeon]|nr:transcriptional regulator [Candidatus Methanofastidiosa archaeon]HPR42516.1 transcriptional regulator [Candidatus Methanofastidiosa archaeon]